MLLAEVLDEPVEAVDCQVELLMRRLRAKVLGRLRFPLGWGWLSCLKHCLQLKQWKNLVALVLEEGLAGEGTTK